MTLEAFSKRDLREKEDSLSKPYFFFFSFLCVLCFLFCFPFLLILGCFRLISRATM